MMKKRDVIISKRKFEGKIVRIILLATALGIAGCSSAGKRGEGVDRIVVTKPLPTGSEAGREEENVDFVALRAQLGLERSPESLGYTEKQFNTCNVGCGYSQVHNCRKLYFSVIHFKLSCRESEGTLTTALTERDIFPIANWKFKWKLPQGSGEAMTDPDGFGQLQVVSATSPRRERLKISVDNDFLYMRANEITKVVAPKDWCRPSRADYSFTSPRTW